MAKALGDKRAARGWPPHHPNQQKSLNAAEHKELSSGSKLLLPAWSAFCFRGYE